MAKVGGKVTTLARNQTGSKSKYYSVKNFEDAWKHSPDSSGKGKHAGIDNVWPESFGKDLGGNIQSLRNEIKSGNFGFRKLRAVFIEKEGGKQRVVCIPTVRDRLFQRVICRLFKDRGIGWQNRKRMIRLADNPVSYGAGIDDHTGTQDAINKAIEIRNKRPWVFKTDIQSFFDRIDRKYLVTKLEKEFRDNSLLCFIEKAVNCEVDDSDPGVKQLLDKSGIKKGEGIRQGMPISSILANFFLREFDDKVYKKMGKSIIRYADDIIVFANSEEECKRYKSYIEKELKKLSWRFHL